MLGSLGKKISGSYMKGVCPQRNERWIWQWNANNKKSGNVMADDNKKAEEEETKKNLFHDHLFFCIEVCAMMFFLRQRSKM